MFLFMPEKLSKCRIKYLGVWLDEHLNFNEQAEYAVGKAMRAFGKIRRLIDGREGITPQTGIMLYKSLVRPHWEFSIAAWLTVAEKGIQSLETAQARSHVARTDGPTCICQRHIDVAELR